MTDVNVREVTIKIFNDSTNDLPEYTKEGDAAMDVRSAVDDFILPRGIKLIPTNLYVEIPEGYKINVLPRSGLAKKGITIANAPGTVDAGYRGNVACLIRNESNDTFDIRIGDRIAQIEVAPVYKIKWWPVGKKDQLSDTTRGEGGFGSSGVK